METEPKCPYCQIPLVKFPAAKTKCKSCGQVFYVRTHPEKHIKVIVTISEAGVLQDQWEHVVTDSQLFRWLPLGGNFVLAGSAKPMIEKPDPAHDPAKAIELLSDLRSKHPDKSDRDIHWLLMNNLSEQFGHDYYSQKQLHFAMAIYLNTEGKNAFPELTIASKMELMAYKEMKTRGASIFTNAGCEKCKKINGLIFTIDHALNDMPLPNPDCAYILEKGHFPFCRCSWNPVF